jgi:hypothetical protein
MKQYFSPPDYHIAYYVAIVILFFMFTSLYVLYYFDKTSGILLDADMEVILFGLFCFLIMIIFCCICAISTKYCKSEGGPNCNGSPMGGSMWGPYS